MKKISERTRDVFARMGWRNVAAGTIYGVLRDAAQEVMFYQVKEFALLDGFERAWMKLAQDVLDEHGDAIDSVLMLQGREAALRLARDEMRRKKGVLR